jgi:hypothetical protein
MEEGLQIRPNSPDKTLTKVTVENKFIAQKLPLHLCPKKLRNFEGKHRFIKRFKEAPFLQLEKVKHAKKTSHVPCRALQSNYYNSNQPMHPVLFKSQYCNTPTTTYLGAHYPTHVGAGVLQYCDLEKKLCALFGSNCNNY